MLINAVADEPTDLTAEAEEALYRLAGEHPPKLEPAEDQAGRRKQRDAWAAWWKENGSKVDLKVLDNQSSRLLGYTLLVEGDGPGRVMELGRDGKPRWVIAGLGGPVDAHVLPRNRVLVAEFGSDRVTERNFQGKILWQKQITDPVNAQRLPNGNTFIATRNILVEVDRAGKTVWSRPCPRVMAGCKGRDGVITCLSGTECLRLTADGKQLKSFPIGGLRFLGGIDQLANGRILIAQQGDGVVTERDGDGKVVWQARAPGITSATRLPNGHTLLANQTSKTLTELDRTGKVVSEQGVGMTVMRARRR